MVIQCAHPSASAWNYWARVSSAITSIFDDNWITINISLVLFFRYFDQLIKLLKTPIWQQEVHVRTAVASLGPVNVDDRNDREINRLVQDALEYYPTFDFWFRAKTSNMCEPMDSSFDSKLDGVHNQLSAQTAGGSATQTNPPVGDSTNCQKATNSFTPLLRPGSMGAVQFMSCL